MWIKQKVKNKFGEETRKLVWWEPEKEKDELPVTHSCAPVLPSVATTVTYSSANAANEIPAVTATKPKRGRKA